MHGDVEPGEAHGLAGGGKAAGVAELGKDRARDLWADAVVAHERAAAGLAAGERPELTIEWGELRVDVLDDGQGDRDLLAGRRRDFERGELIARRDRRGG